MRAETSLSRILAHLQQNAPVFIFVCVRSLSSQSGGRAARERERTLFLLSANAKSILARRAAREALGVGALQGANAALTKLGNSASEKKYAIKFKNVGWKLY
jgi:hypothetical protein